MLNQEWAMFASKKGKKIDVYPQDSFQIDLSIECNNKE